LNAAQLVARFRTVRKRLDKGIPQIVQEVIDRLFQNSPTLLQRPLEARERDYSELCSDCQMARTPDSTPTERAERWLRGLGMELVQVVPLVGDVSARRYFRVHLEGSVCAILAVYPRDLRPLCRRFCETTRLLEERGIRVPAIRAHDCSSGLMLVEDLGSTTLYDKRTRPWSELEQYLRIARQMIDEIQKLPADEVASLNPPLDADLLWRELRQTWTAFLLPHKIGGEGADRLEEALHLLCQRLGEPDPVPAHRDFMARNLVPVGTYPALAVIDHQDLRLGPPAYDVASLCNDSLYPPAALAEELLQGLDPEAYHRCAAQRTLKAVGTFVTFAKRGSRRHLELVPKSLRSFVEHFAKLPEGEALAAGVERRCRSVLRAF